MLRLQEKSRSGLDRLCAAQLPTTQEDLIANVFPLSNGGLGEDLELESLRRWCVLALCSKVIIHIPCFLHFHRALDSLFICGDDHSFGQVLMLSDSLRLCRFIVTNTLDRNQLCPLGGMTADVVLC